jgi:hypothetical protein
LSLPLQEKEGYKPNVDIKYFDKWGYELNQKDAFRDLSQRFHGKALGKVCGETLPQMPVSRVFRVQNCSSVTIQS